MSAKLITYPGHDEWTEVFDLASDPYELKNPVGDEALLKKLRAEFDAKSKAIEFQLPNLPSDSDKPAGKQGKKRGKKKQAAE